MFFTTGLKLTLRRTNDPASARYEKIDEKAFLKQWFKPFTEHSYHTPVHFENQAWVRPTGEGVRSDLVDALFFARFYAARGNMQTANIFYQYTLYYPVTNERIHNIENLSKSIYDILMFHIGKLFYDPYLTRPELLNLLGLLDGKQFTNVPSYSKKQVGEWRSVLKQMIKEDKEHSLQPPPPLEKLPIKERIAELIFRLRGSLFERPYKSSFFDLSNPYEKSLNSNPFYHADRALVKIGYPAVPQLIEAFGDKRFTRSGETIGEKAKLLFTKITGYGFEELYNKNQTEVSDYRKAALAWWANFRSRPSNSH